MIALQEQHWLYLKYVSITQKEQSRRVKGGKRWYKFMPLHLIVHGVFFSKEFVHLLLNLF